MITSEVTEIIRRPRYLLSHELNYCILRRPTVNYKEEVLFQVNYRSDLTTANVVCYNGMLYNITRIDTFEGYKEDLTLYCTLKK